jgi:hypothetical protein
MYVDPSATNATVTGAIRQAARMTGTDFRYLLATARVESDLNPGAKVATSSARGLYQFIEQTWLQTLKEHGATLGYGAYADVIVRLPFGKYVVDDPRMRGAIMNMRSDPTASAVMAGAFTRANAAKLGEALGRAPTDGELYIAHFLGPTGASRLIALAQSQPTTRAAAAFAGAAKANRSIFYDRSGRARSADEVYRALVGRYQLARDGRKAPAPAVAATDAPVKRPAPPLDLKRLADTYASYAIAVASATHGGHTATETPAPANSIAAPVKPGPTRRRTVGLDRVALADTYAPYATAQSGLPRAARTKPEATTAASDIPRPRASIPDTAAPRAARAENTAVAASTTSQAPDARNGETGPIFHGLFRTVGAQEPVAPVVSALWTTPLQLPARKPDAGQNSSPTSVAAPPEPLHGRSGARMPIRDRG